MRLTISLLVTVLMLGVCALARAGYEPGFVRVTCVPQNRYFEIEYTTLGTNVVDGGDFFDLDAWAKQGWRSPSALQYECKLPNSKYIVTSSQPEPRASGICVGAPDIALSVTRNGKPLVKDVTFGQSCSEGPSVSRILVEDGHNGYYAPGITICLFGGDRVPERCDVVGGEHGGDPEIARAAPITQYVVEGCQTMKPEEFFGCFARKGDHSQYSRE